MDGSKVGRDNFELPSLGKKLLQLSLDIHEGRGFSTIRGLNPADFSVEDLTLAYMGVSAHIADMRGRQDRKGNMLGTLCCCLAYLPIYLLCFSAGSVCLVYPGALRLIRSSPHRCR